MTDLAWLDDAKTEGSGIQSAHRILFGKSFERRSDSAFALYRREWNRRPEQRFVGEFPMNLDTELDANCNLFCPMCARQSDPAAKAKGQMTLERCWLEACVANGEPRALEDGGLSVQHLPADARRFIQSVETPGQGRIVVSEGPVLGGVPACPQAEDGAPSAGVVESRDHAHE